MIPIEEWFSLYKKIDVTAAKAAIDATEDDPKDSESQDYYLSLVKHIRDILRYCQETNSELHISDELYEPSEDSVPETGRSKEVVDKYFKQS